MCSINDSLIWLCFGSHSSTVNVCVGNNDKAVHIVAAYGHSFRGVTRGWPWVTLPIRLFFFFFSFDRAEVTKIACFEEK